jgi:hypothetical protein
MGTVTVTTRHVVGLLVDLIHTSGIDPDSPSTMGILLWTAEGEFVPDLLAAADGEEPLIDAVESQLLVGMSTDLSVGAQAHIPATFDGPTVRRSPDATMLAILWPSDPSPARWMVADFAGSCGYDTPERVAHWPVVGAVPFSPADGVEFSRPGWAS